MGNKYLYKPTSWQGFVQQTHYLLSRAGYRYYCVTKYPEKKRDKWDKIDEKLINRYHTNISTKQRSTNKKNKNANFMFLRFEDTAIIFMATNKFEGVKTKVRDGILIEDKFFDIQVKSLKLYFGRATSLKIHYNEKQTLTVSMTEQMYQDQTARLYETALKIAETRNIGLAHYEYSKLNGLPAWRGIIVQKLQLLETFVQELKRHNINVKESQFFVKMKRDAVKVYE